MQEKEGNGKTRGKGCQRIQESMGKIMGRQGKHGRKMKEDKGRTTHEFITSIRAPELILYSVYIYICIMLTAGKHTFRRDIPLSTDEVPEVPSSRECVSICFYMLLCASICFNFFLHEAAKPSSGLVGSSQKISFGCALWTRCECWHCLICMQVLPLRR